MIPSLSSSVFSKVFLSAPVISTLKGTPAISLPDFLLTNFILRSLTTEVMFMDTVTVELSSSSFSSYSEGMNSSSPTSSGTLLSAIARRVPSPAIPMSDILSPSSAKLLIFFSVALAEANIEPVITTATTTSTPVTAIT